MECQADADDVLDILAASDAEVMTPEKQHMTSSRKRPAEAMASTLRPSRIQRHAGHGNQKWAEKLFTAFAAEVSAEHARECVIQSLCSGMGTEHMAMKAHTSGLSIHGFTQRASLTPKKCL